MGKNILEEELRFSNETSKDYFDADGTLEKMSSCPALRAAELCG